MADVIEFRQTRAEQTPAQYADLWEGVVRFMEVNERDKIEIGLKEARWIAVLARKAAKCA